MGKLEDIVAVDLVGVCTDISKTPMQAQFEYLHHEFLQKKVGLKKRKGLGKSPIEDYLEVTKQYGSTSKKSGSDHALKEWFETMGEFGLTKKGLEESMDNYVSEGYYNKGVVNALEKLVECEKRIILVSKNPKAEVLQFARKINEIKGKEIIHDVIGSELIYNYDGEIIGVNKLISDKGYQKIGDTKCVLKIDEMNKYTKNRVNYDFISDEKDLDIASAVKNAKRKSILLIYEPIEGEKRDPYFARVEDYQRSTLETGKYTHTINNQNVKEELYKFLS